MNERFEREIGLINEASYELLRSTLIVLFGLGGVGGYAFEGLIRAGIENFIIVDKDTFDITNINRQLASHTETIGMKKAKVYLDRAISINKNVNVAALNIDIKNHVKDIFKTVEKFNNVRDIYAIDCIDDIEAKFEIIKYCNDNSIKLISSMGTANHINSTNIKITDIKNTRYCPIAKIIRKKLKDMDIENLDVLFIDEEPKDTGKLSTISYIPSISGLKIAEYVIGKII